MKIIIKSVDTHGQNYEKDFEIIEFVDLMGSKEYKYKDEFGICKIINKSDRVEIFRRGMINSKQVFKLLEKTSFIYMTKEFKGEYEIFTKKLERYNGKIVLEYDIMERSEIINRVKLEISYFKDN